MPRAVTEAVEGLAYVEDVVSVQEERRLLDVLDTLDLDGVEPADLFGPLA